MKSDNRRPAISTSLKLKPRVTHGDLCIEEKARYGNKRSFGATLGELIVALTDEVMPFVRDPASLHLVVSYILNDVLVRRRMHIPERSRRKYTKVQ